MDPAAIQAASHNAEQLSAQTASERPRLQQASEAAEHGIPRTQTQSGVAGCSNASAELINRLAVVMDQQSQKLQTSADSTTRTDSQVGSGLRAIHRSHRIDEDY
jgi:hypothetical protein